LRASRRWTAPLGQSLAGFGANGFVGFVPTKFSEKALRAVITIAGGEQETIRELLLSADGKNADGKETKKDSAKKQNE
jgi:hypothetical protein